MHTDNLIINDCRTGQPIECITELLPHFDGKAAAAFIVKAINAVNAGTLVVAAEQKEVFRILDLVGENETNDFNGLFAPVDVVAEKEIVGLHFLLVVMTVNTTNSSSCVKVLQVEMRDSFEKYTHKTSHPHERQQRAHPHTHKIHCHTPCTHKH
jgi:hypothetical protein